MKPIVFFDGVCGLCNRFVNFLFKIDRHEKFLVAALQGETAAKYLPSERREQLSSIIVRAPDGRLRDKSDAVFYVLSTVGGPWRALGGLNILPRFLRDSGYNMVASSRYAIFGKSEACRRPTADERQRFLP